MSTETITTISPFTNSSVVTRPGISRDELSSIPQAAQAAFRSFSRSTTLGKRQEIVAHALKILSSKKDVLAREITEQMGRPISYTGVEVATAIKRGEYLSSISSSALEGSTDGIPENGFRRFVKKQPIGVVLVIFPWNVSL